MTGAARIAVVLGTRPEAIKLAPLILALHRAPDLEPVVVSTGQHRDVLDEVFGLFDIRPDVDLAAFRPGQTLAVLAGEVMAGLDGAYADTAPHAVVVQGDTTSTLIGALAAFYRQIPVVHLEAGLRSADVANPFPEEANRRLVTPIAALHLVATAANEATLLGEGVAARDIVVTGNTVIDALYETVGRRPALATPGLAELLGCDRRMVTVTAHRRESWGEPLEQIASAVRDIADDDTVQVVWPLHPNPAVQSVVRRVVGGHPRVALVPALPYGDFVQLLAASSVVVSDSGGVQEECPALGVPVVVTREVTERHEAVACGAAVLAGTDRHRIVQLTRRFLAAGRRSEITSPYGDGKATGRAVDAIRLLVGSARRLPSSVSG